jgi:hypothetical protein
MNSEQPIDMGQTSDPTSHVPNLNYPSTGMQPTGLPEAARGPLPQVRTEDPPTAVARLRGSVSPMQTR